LFAKHGKEGPAYHWLSTEDWGDLPGIDFEGRGEIAALFAQVYDLLCDDEDKWMVPFRRMLQRVCRSLNGDDWRSVCAVTDDFFVVPADGSQYFANDYPDIVRSVPAARLKLLRSRGFGPPEEWAD
jgi:hypothetical protein